MSLPQLLGAPCGHYGSYIFHKGFKFFKHGKFRTINLGEFFFVRISSNHDPCIGELELLWNEEHTDNKLTSLRLYFLPEQTPEGRHSGHGQDEVLVASDKVVLRLEDLVNWITDEVEWNHGLLAFFSDKYQNGDDKGANSDRQEAAVNGLVLKTEPSIDPVEESATGGNSSSSAASDERTPVIENGFPGTGDVPTENAEDKQLVKIKGVVDDEDELKVMILSYPSYCRYRTILKRLDGMTDKWMAHSMVIALGGFDNLGRNTHILFCRDMFDHEELAHHELNCDYLAPSLKMKRRKKKGKNARSTSPGSESNTSEENKDSPVKSDVTNGFKQPPCKTEQEFLHKLYKYMKKRKTPIHRVPHLGFKQIDLFVFYSFAQKLGGYDKITSKRLWKHVYDVLGGDPGSTSAATCTRRHYEKLLLPFERFMDGKEYKPKQSRKQQTPQKKLEENENEVSEKVIAATSKGDNEDAYAFTDSNHENSKDSLIQEEEVHSGEEAPLNENYSDEDSKSIWSIQKTLDGRDEEQEKNGSKAIKPLIIQKEQNESFSEKERKWNEIRRKNALARKWVRQLRPSRGGKMPGADKSHVSETEVCPPEENIQPEMVCKEAKPVSTCSSDSSQSVLPAMNNTPINQEIFEPPAVDPGHLPEKFKPATIHCDSRLEYTKKGGYLPKTADAFLASRNNQMHQKAEALGSDKKSWCGYSRDGVYQVAPAPERYPYGCGFEMSMIQSFAKQDYKMSRQSENGLKPYTLCGNSSESSALSSSEQEGNNSDMMANLSQRRPSVIQHTERVSSPSPSPNVGSDSFLESLSHELSLSASPGKMTLSGHLAHTMTGKVTEWLSKGVPEAIACKTPCAMSDKASELHDKVLMPSSCKTPGPGTGKVPMYGSKNKMEVYAYPGTSKAIRDKGMVHYRQVPQETPKRPTAYMSGVTLKVSPAYQKAFHPISAATISPSPYIRPIAKPEQTFAVGSKNKMYASDTVYNQPKRHKLNVMQQVPTPVPPRPSLLPFSRQHTYRTSPLSDIPKPATVVQSDYTNVALDLSVKKKPPPAEKAPSIKPPQLTDNSLLEGVCLDLTVRKKTSLTHESAIENITPPLPISPKLPPHHAPSYSSKPLKPLPNLIALHDLMREEANWQKSSSSSAKPAAIGSSSQPTIPISSAMPSNSAMYAGSAQSNKIPQGFIAPLPEAAFSKEMAKSLYMSPDPTQFPSYVIPPFYTTGWPTANKLPNPTSSSNSSSAAASPNSLKEAMNHGVFPKQYMYNMKHPFPLVCKDNGYYPPSCK